MAEYITFKKDEEIRTVEVVGDRVVTAIDVEGERLLFNPTLEEFVAAGWEQYTPETETPMPTYDELWVMYKREQYSLDKELDLLARKMAASDDDENVQEEFATYMSFVEECKNRANDETGGENG